jgi:hypothetical protein
LRPIWRPASAFRLAGFFTHATYAPGGGERERDVYGRLRGRVVGSYEKASREKGIEWCGCFSCPGAPAPFTEACIHQNIVKDAGEWERHIAEVRKHPDESDMENAREFARAILAGSGKAAA